MPHEVPECFCDEHDMRSCDWVVEVECRYYRPTNPQAVKSTVPWRLENIPQVLAQVIMQTTVDAVNERSAQVYLEWLETCFGENDPVVVQARKTLKV